MPCLLPGARKFTGNHSSVDLGTAGAAAGDISAREFEQGFLPGRLCERAIGRGTFGGDRRGQKPLGLCQVLGGGVEARMADLFEPVRQDVLDKTLEENDRVEGDALSVLRPEGDFVLGHVQEP